MVEAPVFSDFILLILSSLICLTLKSDNSRNFSTLSEIILREDEGSIFNKFPIKFFSEALCEIKLRGFIVVNFYP